VVSNDFDATARHYWAMAQRVGKQIAELPIKVRERALTGTETCLREAGSELGLAGQQLESLVDLQMKAIRQVVADLDNETSRRKGAKAHPWVFPFASLNGRFAPLGHACEAATRNEEPLYAGLGQHSAPA
jgi:hypothetical protein